MSDQEIKLKKPSDSFTSRKYIYAIGRRKESVAQVRIYAKGSGKVMINEKSLSEFFPSFKQHTVLQPFEEIGKSNKYDVTVKVSGGGLTGQSDAVRLGISRCLVQEDEAMRKPLKAKGFLKRDPRAKERKKPGLHGARRAPQWKKR